MIQGPSDAVFYAPFPDQLELSLSCAINSGTADCVGEIDAHGMTIATSFQEPAKPSPPDEGGSDSKIEEDDGSTIMSPAMWMGLLSRELSLAWLPRFWSERNPHTCLLYDLYVS